MWVELHNMCIFILIDIMHFIMILRLVVLLSFDELFQKIKC